MSIDFSYTATRKERERYENNLTLGGTGRGPLPGPLKKRTDFSQAVHHIIAIEQQAGKPNPYIPKHVRFRQRPIEEKAKLERQGNVGAGTTGHNLLPPLYFNLVDATRMAGMARIGIGSL